MGFKAFCLLLIILVLGIFIYLKMQTLGSDQSSFNKTTRYSLGKYPFLRYIFSLHKDGDARAEYLKGSQFIIIEVVQISGSPLSDDTIQAFANKVTQYTGKPTKIYNVDTIKNGQLNQADLDNIVRDFHRHLEPGGANLFVMYGDDFASSGNEVGKTYQEFGMV